MYEEPFELSRMTLEEASEIMMRKREELIATILRYRQAEVDAVNRAIEVKRQNAVGRTEPDSTF